MTGSTLNILCLTCSCHHRNDKLPADGRNYILFFGSALGPNSGIWETLEAPLGRVLPVDVLSEYSHRNDQLPAS